MKNGPPTGGKTKVVMYESKDPKSRNTVAVTVNAFDSVASDIKDRIGETAKEETMTDFLSVDTHRLTLLPAFAHKEPKDNDLGLPKHPIFSNYVKYLWTSHKRTGGVEVAEPSSRRPAR